MPELPDVEIFRRHLEDTSLNRRIEQVDVLDAGLLEKVTPTALAQRLRGRRFTQSRRHGKHLLVAVNAAAWMTLHFGMTGSLQFFADGEVRPRHCRIRFDFAAGGHLAYVNVRRLGHVGLVRDPDAFIRESALGPDALDPDFDHVAFEAALRAKPRSKVKAFLMDQSVIAGIGNIYSDEILFQAGLHPNTKVIALDRPTTRRLFATMRGVLKTAIACGAGSEIALARMPKGFLLPERRDGADCPRCGAAIARMKTGGRHAYFCPRCQSSE